MRSQSRRLDLIPSPDCDSLTRWGVADCDEVDRRALAESLARLQDDESTPPPDAAGLIGRIRSRHHQALLEIIADAVALATACEAAHAADDRWPHGLSDRLILHSQVSGVRSECSSPPLCTHLAHLHGSKPPG